MAQQDQGTVDVQQVANTPQAGDRVTSVVPKDLQNTQLVIDIGDKTIEITHRGNLTLQSIGPQASEDQQFLDQMRGWLTTVATLFIGIAFQVAMQPPSWIPQDWYEVFRKGPSGALTTMPAPSPSPNAAAAATSTITYGQAYKAYLYVIFNTFTFAISLAMVVLLLLMKKSTPTHTVRLIAIMVASLCITVGTTFAVGNSYGPDVLWIVGTILLCYGCGTILFFLLMPRIMKVMLKPIGRSRAN